MLGENLMEGAWFWKAPIAKTLYQNIKSVLVVVQPIECALHFKLPVATYSVN